MPSSGDLAKAVCQRCNFKVAYTELREDGNVAKLMVCRDCWDEKDPYRLPARQTEDITLQNPRPDKPVPVSSNRLESEDGFYIMSEDGTYIKVS